MSDANFRDAQNPYSAPYAEVGEKINVAGPIANFRGYAGFWIRVLAYLIDVFVFAIGAGIIVGGASFLLNLLGVDLANGYAIGGLYLFYMVLLFAYFVGMPSSSNQGTLGKMALGLKVVDLQGRRISFWRSLGRFLSFAFLSGIFLIGYLMVAFTERKQGLHDMIAGTLVIKTR